MSRTDLPPDISPSAHRLVVLAERWRQAAKTEASGWMAGTPASATAHDVARTLFEMTLKTTDPRVIQEICSALAAVLPGHLG